MDFPKPVRKAPRFHVNAVEENRRVEKNPVVRKAVANPAEGNQEAVKADGNLPAGNHAVRR